MQPCGRPLQIHRFRIWRKRLSTAYCTAKPVPLTAEFHHGTNMQHMLCGIRQSRGQPTASDAAVRSHSVYWLPGYVQAEQQSQRELPAQGESVQSV